MIFTRPHRGTRPGTFRGVNHSSLQARGLVHWWPVTSLDGFDSADTRPSAVRDVLRAADASNTSGAYVLGTAPTGVGGYAITSSAFGQLAVTPSQAPFGSAATVSAWVQLRVATPVVEPATGFCHLQSVASLSAYPYTDGVIYCATLRSSSRYSFSPLSSVDRTQPHLVTITSDGTTWRFFQNARLVYEDAADASVPTFSSSRLHGSDASYWLNGWSWDWRLYNRALSPAEVLALYDPASRFDLYAPLPRRLWVPVVANVARPSADVSAGTWTPSTGSDLFAMVNDGGDSTYIRSSVAAVSDTCELDFPAMGTPAAGTVTFNIRHRKASA